MKKSIISSMAVSTALLLTLTGCGSDSDSTTTPVAQPSTMTGQFIDSAVSGLDYSCSSGSVGITNENGEFTCNSDDIISFSLNGYALGYAPMQSIITPRTLFADETVAINLAQLLQTLDGQGDLSDGIQINTTMAASLQGSTIALDDADFDNLMSTLLGTVLVSETDAATHLDETLGNGGTDVNTAPVANAGIDQSVKVGDTVTLNSSNSSDADGDQLTSQWRFISRPSGSTASLLYADTVTPTFTADAEGEYVVELTVNDGTVDSVVDTVSITSTPSSSNSIPVANAGPDQIVYIDDMVTLDGSSSSDADADFLTYKWELAYKPTGSSATLSNDTSTLSTFEADKEGNYYLTLTVNDGTDEHVAAVKITVEKYELFYSSDGTDYTTAMTTDSSGHIYAAGKTHGTFEGNVKTAEGYNADAFVVKFDTNGSMLWVKQFGTTESEELTDITTDTQGNIYVTGDTRGTFYGNSYIEGLHTYTTKLDTMGNILWTKETNATHSNGVKTDANGNVYIAGSGYEETVEGSNYTKMFATKFDNDGTMLWTQYYGSVDNDVANDIAIDTQGDLVITGQTFGAFEGNSKIVDEYDIDLFVIKLDAATGSQQWSKQYGTSENDIAYKLTADNSDGIYLLGETRGSFGEVANTSGMTDVFVIKLDADGALLWTNQYASTDNWGNEAIDNAHSIIWGNDNNLYVSGLTNDVLEDNTDVTQVGFLKKLDSNGNDDWTKLLEEGLIDFEYDVDGYIYGTQNGVVVRH